MKSPLAAFTAICLALSLIACSREDDERARRKAEGAKQELHKDLGQAKQELHAGARQARDDIRKAGSELDRGAKRLKEKVNQSLDNNHK